jgi:hypothetical protein
LTRRLLLLEVCLFSRLRGQTVENRPPESLIGIPAVTALYCLAKAKKNFAYHWPGQWQNHRQKTFTLPNLIGDNGPWAERAKEANGNIWAGSYDPMAENITPGRLRWRAGSTDITLAPARSGSRPPRRTPSGVASAKHWPKFGAPRTNVGKASWPQPGRRKTSSLYCSGPP